MTKFSRKAADEVPEKDSDVARRRTKPADRGPSSPKQIGDVYAKGTVVEPHPRGQHGDGLAGRKAYEHERKLQKPQGESAIEGREPSYDNDTARGWLRGENEDGRGRGFDHGKLDPDNAPPKARGPRNTASGRDMQRSPFSAAHKTYSEE
jgi:hypothetical protein